jgi:hypothetical protein
MRKARSYLIMILCSILAGGCELTDDGTYVAPITNYEKIGGSWILKSIKQIDETAKASLSKPDEQVLTNEFTFKSFQITLNTDEKFNPGTFEVTGTSPELFLKSGYWDLDNPFVNTDGTATHIRLYADEARTQLIDQLSLNKIPGTSSILEFKLTRSVDNTPFVSYLFQVAPAPVIQ